MCARLPSSETYGLPSPISRAKSAAVAGIGEAAPTGTGRALGIDIALEILRKTFRRCREMCVFAHMRGVDPVAVRQRQRPGAAPLDRDGIDIEARQSAG